MNNTWEYWNPELRLWVNNRPNYAPSLGVTRPLYARERNTDRILSQQFTNGAWALSDDPSKQLVQGWLFNGSD